MMRMFWAPGEAPNGSRHQSLLFSAVQYISSAFTNHRDHLGTKCWTAEAQGRTVFPGPWKPGISPASLASLFPPSNSRFFHKIFLLHPKLPRFGGAREGEKGTSLFRRPYCMSSWNPGERYQIALFLHIADRTKATRNPYHSSHSTAILTSKDPTWLQMFVGLQHNSQSKHLVIFKSSSTTSISLHRKQEWDMEAQFKEKEHTGKKG